ncbi:general secretion pathway protein GspB [Cognatilysobacter bugurensis]|uniref:general secretion pathway protein GspB n=1 Tax=Cognatilysobacter bugurensis TaxID=543356 RepID=UPI001673CDAE|nr:general secretion pathway protein GspB [Lysobacter bugurensis]
MPAAIALAVVVLLGTTGYRMFFAADDGAEPSATAAAPERTTVPDAAALGANAATPTAIPPSLQSQSIRQDTAQPADSVATAAPMIESTDAGVGAAGGPASVTGAAVSPRAEPRRDAGTDTQRPALAVNAVGAGSAGAPPSEPRIANNAPAPRAASPAAVRPPADTALPLPPSSAVRAPALARTAASAPAADTGRPPGPSPAARSAPAPAASISDRPLRLADLAPADRRALPPLRMSMHLFAAAPAERFVILDGQRVGEGDRLGEAVVDEITADGAVLTWQGRRVWVPVR